MKMARGIYSTKNAVWASKSLPQQNHSVLMAHRFGTESESMLVQ